MQFVFLGARLPLTKTFVQRNGTIAAAPYPHITRVTSHHEEIKTLSEFAERLKAHAKLGHCLFGGLLMQPLRDESRAGHTKHTPREWVVFDFDKVKASSAEEAIKLYLPRECQGVSYVAHISASMFRPDVTTWSGHVFMWLDAPVEEQRVRQWFESLNFTVPALEQQLSLSDSLQALHWPLDRTVAHNSKLIYIAPPKCFGFKPAVTEAITYVKKKMERLTIPPFQVIDSMAVRSKINELRARVGEDPIDYATQVFEGHELMIKSGICEIHGVRTSGDHYIRFNLNGGDSYAYYIDLRNPALIKNFKGEPMLKTADAAPDLYKALRAKAPQIVTKQPLEEGVEVLAFYATNQSSSVKVGTFSPIERRLTMNSATETSAKAWLAEYGILAKGYLPHMDIVFDPTLDIQYVPNATSINTFRASEYMIRERTSSKPSSAKEIPPLLNKIIQSMLGNPPPEMLDHFMNWLAYIFQTREKTGVAWVLHGEEGTGKGSFVKYVLAPLFGPEHVRAIQFPSVTSTFNAFLEGALFVVIEEADMRAVANTADLEARMRHYITDSPIEINQKGVKTYQAENYSNFFLFSNKTAMIQLPKGNRRYMIAERQTERLFFTPNELQQLMNGVELDAFADVLRRWVVDPVKAHMLIHSDAADQVHEATTSVNQLIAEAIQAGDLQFFIDRTPSKAEAEDDFYNRFNPMTMYREKLGRYIADSEAGRPTLIRDEDLYVLFRTLIPDPRYFQDGRTWRMRHYKQLGLDTTKQQRISSGEKPRGMIVQWKRAELPLDLRNIEVPETASVTELVKGRK